MILEAFNQAELSYKEKLKTITLKMAMVERKKDSWKFIIYIKIFELCKIEKSYIQKVYSFFKKFSCNYWNYNKNVIYYSCNNKYYNK